MSLRIEDALREGFGRTFKRNGLLLVAAFVVFGLLSTVVSQSMSGAYLDFLSGTGMPAGGAPETGGPPEFGGSAFGMAPEEQTPLALPVSVPLPILAVLSVLFAFVAEALRIVAIRVFATEETERIPGDLTRRSIGWAVLNGVIVGIVTAILTAIGFVLLIIPGIFLAVSFYFVRQAVAIEDDNFVDAMSRSWNMASGNRLEVFALLVIVWVIGLLAGVPSVAAFFLTPLVGTLLSTLVGGFTTVFGLAVATRAFEQLRGTGPTAKVEATP
jgi:hypothetical protein